MKVHEYQAKEIFDRYQIPIPKGRVAFTVQEVIDVAQQIPQAPYIVKAQIHAGGRGKGGGVKLAASIDELKKHAKAILGMRLVTPQTGSEGKKVKRLLVEAGAKIKKEFYLGITLDRSVAKPVIIASPAGGMAIEEVAQATPEKIFKERVDSIAGLRNFQGRRLATALGLSKEPTKEFFAILSALVRLFQDYDCSLVEVNPLVLTEDDRLIAVDAKVSFDDNALYRHPELNKLFDPNEEDPAETKAKTFDLSYISLDGSIGCMVNGAGLAMATMDIIKLAGGEPANFLDVGGSASEEKVMEAFKIILSDKKVKAILVNIFGGIMKCDIIAIGIVSAAKQLELKVPLVVRLEGTNVEKGKEILEKSGLTIIAATDLKDAAEKAVAASGGKA